jgi:hypothetical protein
MGVQALSVSKRWLSQDSRLVGCKCLILSSAAQTLAMVRFPCGDYLTLLAIAHRSALVVMAVATSTRVIQVGARGSATIIAIPLNAAIKLVPMLRCVSERIARS